MALTATSQTIISCTNFFFLNCAYTESFANSLHFKCKHVLQSGDPHYFLQEIKALCVSDTSFMGKHLTDTHVLQKLMLAPWHRAVETMLEQQILQDDSLSVEMQLLKGRVEWLQRQDSHSCNVWISGHVRIYIWLKCHTDNKNASPLSIAPRASLCVSELALPDIKQTLLQMCESNDQNTANIDRFYHLLSKGLPKRCQIRELLRFLETYCTTDILIETTFKRMIACSFCGLYSHNTKNMPFGFVLATISNMCFSVSNTSDFLQWMMQSSKNAVVASNKQLLMSFVIREFVCSAAKQMPTLRSALYRSSNWENYETETIRVMNAVRAGILEKHNNCAWDVTISNSLEDVNVHVLANTDKRRSKHMHRQISLTSVIKIFGTLKSKRNTMFIALPISEQYSIQQMLNSLSKTISAGARGIMQRMRSAGASVKVMCIVKLCLKGLHSNTTLKNIRAILFALLQQDVMQYALFELEFKSMVSELSTRVYSLPQHVFEKQTIALDKAWQPCGGIQKSIQAGMFIVCTACGQVKTSIASVLKSNKKKPQISVPHIASCKLAVDVESNQLVCEETIHPKQSSKQTIDCRIHNLCILNLSGKALMHKNKMYTLCISCACSMQMSEDMSMMCVACKSKHVQRNHCSVCLKSHNQMSNIFCVNETYENVMQLISICQTCRSHVLKRMLSGLCTLSELRKKHQNVQINRQLMLPGICKSLSRKRI